MILRNPSSFQQGDKVQIVLGEINLEAGANKEYPHMGTGIVILPYFTDQKGKVSVDSHARASLEDEQLILVSLDEPFIWYNPDKRRREFITALTVPEWLLKEPEPEEES